MVIIFEAPYATIRLNEEIQAVELTWADHVGSEDFRYTLMKTMNAVQFHKCSRLMIDGSSLIVILPEDQAWSAEYIPPKAAAIGLRKMASVNPQNIVAKMFVDKFVRKGVGGGLPFQMNFSNSIDEARNWLRD